MSGYEILPFPSEREIVVDSGYLGTGRHIEYGLAEVDVTLARERLRSQSPADGPPLSFTAFVVASFARAVAAHPLVQAYRDWRGRLVVFHDVDVTTMIEPQPGAVAIPYVVRQANRKTVWDITNEIRTVQAGRRRLEQQSKLNALAPKLPRFVRLLFFRIVKKNPHWFKRVGGTVVLTSIGMFAKGGAWGMTFLPLHNLGLTVGGISQKPGVHEGAITIREFLDLTVAFDHDVVDGAPASRFGRTLAELIEEATVLDEVPA